MKLNLTNRMRCSMSIVLFAVALSTLAVPNRATAAPATSCSLTAGSACLPPDDAGDGTGTLLATSIDPFSFTTAAGVIGGAIKAEVFREAGGTLDFYYIIFNAPNSVGALTSELTGYFTGWSTAVAFRSDGSQVQGFVDGNIPPSSATRDASGASISFDFAPIPPNERSRVVVISTNATDYTAGYTEIDGSGPLATFEPAVPEPASLGLVGCCSIGLVFVARRMTYFSARSRNRT